MLEELEELELDSELPPELLELEQGPSAT